MGTNRLLIMGVVGSTLTALCCLTPLLVGLLGLVGLGWVTGYWDYVLLPVLAGFLGLTVYGLWHQNRQGRSSCCVDLTARHDHQ